MRHAHAKQPTARTASSTSPKRVYHLIEFSPEQRSGFDFAEGEGRSYD
jgi:hypothetical protein